MKMYKRIFGVLLCLCMLLGAVSLASAEENGATTGGSQTGGSQTHENHPICGATHTDIGDHKGECPNLEWTKLYMDEDGKLCYGDGQAVTEDTTYNYYTLGSGNYYLDTDVTVTKVIKITGNVTICLNGHDLTGRPATDNQNTITNLLETDNSEGAVVLNICNCHPDSGGVCRTNDASSSNKGNAAVLVGKQGTFNLFSGKISRENGGGESCAVKLDSQQSSQAEKFNMYGGEVSNNGTADNAAVSVGYSLGTYNINIYAGNISAAGDGIDRHMGGEIQILIAGGSINGGKRAVYAGNASLTLSGSPILNGSDADIYLYSNTSVTVTDDFDPTTKVSVAKSDHGVFAKPAASGSSLAEKTNYFVSAETGYCVTTTTDGNLQLTPCEITQPTESNTYTVSANGTPTYRWYAAKQDYVPVTNKNARDKDNYYWDGEWSIEDRNSAYISDQSIFSIYMKKDYTLKLSCENSFQGSITEVNLYNSSNEEVGEKETVMGTSGETIYKFTAPADGDYTLRLSGSGYSGEGYAWTSLSFTATVTGDVPDTEQQPVSTGATLDTSKLCKGPYICRVTWQGETGKGATTIIDSNPVTLNNSHTAAAATRENENPATCTADGSYDEVVKCSRCGTEISRTSKTIPALGHDFAAATCTAPKTCKRDGCTATEGTALGHDFENSTIYRYNGTQHWKKCSRCDAEDTDHKTNHNVVTDEAKPATTTETGLTEGKHCDVCGKVLVAQEVTPKLTPRYYYNSTTTTTKDTTKKDNTKSPGTFDPGVGLYALTAVLSVTGMAWVGRKKH